MWHTGWIMNVPYAKKWQNETDELRKIVLDCDLVEELKWGKPCFTYQKKNVAIIIPLKVPGLDRAWPGDSRCEARFPGTCPYRTRLCALSGRGHGTSAVKL